MMGSLSKAWELREKWRYRGIHGFLLADVSVQVKDSGRHCGVQDAPSQSVWASLQCWLVHFRVFMVMGTTLY